MRPRILKVSELGFRETSRITNPMIDYLEFLIDGEPIPLDDPGLSPFNENMIPPIGEYLGLEPGQGFDGRVSLVVCEICGDIGCGAITFKLLLEGDYVTWKDFGGEDWKLGEDEIDLDTRVGPYCFERRAYEKVIKTMASHRYTGLGAWAGQHG